MQSCCFEVLGTSGFIYIPQIGAKVGNELRTRFRLFSSDCTVISVFIQPKCNAHKVSLKKLTKDLLSANNKSHFDWNG